jgi:hypothetical protein
MRTIRAMAVLAALGAAGCTLADVVVPESEDVLVVEAVLRTDLAAQTILLHRSVRGSASGPEPGATVVVRGPDGSALRFVEGGPECIANRDAYGADPEALEVLGSCYTAGADAPDFVRPGATYSLEVTTTRGEQARGWTTVPADFALLGLPFSRSLADEPVPCAVAPRTPLPIRWTRASGAWSYIAPLRLFGLAAALPPELEVPEPLELIGLAISASDTQIVLPDEFGIFNRFQLDQELLRALQGGLPPGTRAEVTIAAADRNYVNGVRGGSFNPSGRVRISSVGGDAVGVFGSLVPLRTVVEAGPPAEGRPSCPAG